MTQIITTPDGVEHEFSDNASDDVIKKALKAYSGQKAAPQTEKAPPPDEDWGIKGWQGDITMPQSVRDWGNRAANEALAYSIPSLRAEAEAAKKRMDPASAASADLTGSMLSPTNLLYGVPYAGPGLAGGSHEGIKSYMQGNDPKTVMEDTVVGAGEGYVGAGAAKLAPKVLPAVAKQAVTVGGPLSLGWLGHQLLGGDTYRELANASVGLSTLPGWSNLGKRIEAPVRSLASSPWTQQTIKNLTLGVGSLARQEGGPYDQWIPSQ